MQKVEKNNFISIYGIAAMIAYLVLNQGGYFAGAVVSAGLIVALLMLKVRVRFKPVELVFLGFSMWYLFCSVRTGFNVRYISKGILPLSCLMFKTLLPDNPEESAGLCEKVLKISFYITVLSIIIGLYSCFKAVSLRRLIFPFRYANTSGIFFGVMFILARYGGFEWAKKRQWVFFAALAMTQSVGAIGLTVMAEIILGRNLKKTLILLGCIAVGGILLKGRVYQSIGTFIERFLQMRDGFVCMLDNPLFGIGAGRWALAKNLYQSGFYDAKEIHGSLAQIGADSGIIGLMLFVVAMVWSLVGIKFKNKAYLAGIIMILLHSFMDFSFTFAAMGYLIMILYSCGEINSHKVFTVKKVYKQLWVCAMAIMFVILSVGMYQIKKLDGINVAKNYPKYIKYYDSNVLSQKDNKTTENYAKALYATGNKGKCLEVIENIDVLSADMIILKKGCTGEWREVLTYLEAQPYNTAVYKTVCYNSNDEALQKEAEEMLDKSIDSMSFLGKILFNFKGEEIL